MRRITLLLVLLISGCLSALAQPAMPAITGLVRSMNTLVSNWEVRVARIPDSTHTIIRPGIDDFAAVVRTDSLGRYWLMGPYLPNEPNLYTISTFDPCDSMWVRYVAAAGPNGIVFDIELCTGTPPPPPPTGCNRLSAGFQVSVSGLAVAAQALNPLPGQVDFWEYGDGNIDSGQVCGHVYNLPGTYVICHKAYLDSCARTECQTVVIGDSTLHYASGFVYADNQCLQDSILVEYVSLTGNDFYSTINDSGCFYHLQVPEGRYIIRATPIAASLINQGYMPTYLGDVLDWAQSTMPMVTANSDFYSINLIRADTILQRNLPGKIQVKMYGNGTLVPSTISGSPDRLYATAAARILLSTRSGKTIGWTAVGVNSTDAEFASLPAGTYRVKPEHPAIPSAGRDVTVVIGTAPTQAEFNVVGNTVGPVGPTATRPTLNGHLTAYPNPAGHQVTLSLAKGSGPGTIRLLSADGREAARFEVHDLSRPVVVPIGMLKAGLYSAVISGGTNAQATVRVQVAR